MSRKTRQSEVLKRRQASKADVDPDEVPDEGPQDVEPGQMAQLIVDARRGSVDREAASAISKPLGDLAQAFAMQAEILKTLHDNQSDIQKSLNDDKKSEMMLNSTHALNDTFKGLRNTQGELLDELKRGKGRSSKWQWAVFGLAVIAIGVSFWLWRDTQRGLDETGKTIDQQIALLGGESKEDLKREREESKRLFEELSQASGNERVTQAKMEELRRRFDAMQRQRETFAIEVATMRTERDTAVSENEKTLAQLAELDTKYEKLNDQLGDALRRRDAAEEKARRLNDQILSRLQNQGSSALDPMVDAPPPIVDGAKEMADALALQNGKNEKSVTPAAKAADEKTMDAHGLAAEVNVLMSKHRSTNRRYTFEKIGSVKGGKLRNVIYVETVPQRGVQTKIIADEAFIELSPRGDLIEIHFAEGTKRSYRQATGKLSAAFPFYNGKFRTQILCTNADDWRKQNWTFLDVQ